MVHINNVAQYIKKYNNLMLKPSYCLNAEFTGHRMSLKSDQIDLVYVVFVEGFYIFELILMAC